ncbi:hypothetical protein [Actinoallomurus iriomotensis]|uniref:DUF8129 domain-containing protein n=1 Tax=Actinoallomurus iriomotensis TaxID=478107 RepID=A0A9W6RCE5_9ACTN|nr:hypothetical protein [Actinoallomurus iriomotensis]GLY73294.1 hypothetical protein Airi01_015610 [Actinoallomurus iriomotensis]
MTRSPRQLREQVKDTVSELPIQAARLAVMGVGRALLLTDRLRKDYREARESGLSPVLGRLKNDAENLTGMVVGKVAGNGRTAEPSKGPAAGDSEISVGKPKPSATTRPQRPAERPKPATAPPTRPSATSRPKAAGKPAAARSTAAKPSPKPAPKPSPKPSPKPAAKAKPAAAAKAKQAETKTTQPKPRAKAAANLPISGYDEATLASVRARLRGLDAKQVGELRDYERSHAARADFLRMYENRIAKLREG